MLYDFCLAGCPGHINVIADFVATLTFTLLQFQTWQLLQCITYRIWLPLMGNMLIPADILYHAMAIIYLTADRCNQQVRHRNVVCLEPLKRRLKMTSGCHAKADIRLHLVQALHQFVKRTIFTANQRIINIADNNSLRCWQSIFLAYL